MILGFKHQFKPLILKGIKKHTIREDSKNRWKEGNVIHAATGVRTKKYNCFELLKCVSVQSIDIVYMNSNDLKWVFIYIDGTPVGGAFFEKDILKRDSGLIRQIATNDGFDSVEGFLKWFDKDFKGKIIHWTEISY